MRQRLLGLGAVLALVAAAAAWPAPALGDKPRPAGDDTWFVPDDDWLERFTEKAGRLAAQGKGMPAKTLRDRVAVDFSAALPAPAGAPERREPEELYRRAFPSVLVIGSVVPPEKPGEAWAEGRLATAWALSADGVIVTNWHLFDDVADGEVFAAMDSNGSVYPLTEVLAVDRRADVAAVRVAAKGLTPLPLARRPAPVGAWVGILGHPGDCYYTFTQGAVSRYCQSRPEDDGEPLKWVGVTADYAYGSSGSPVFDRTGAVVAMAAQTVALDYPAAAPEIAPPAPADAKPAARRGRRPIPVRRDAPKADPAKPAVPDAAPVDEGSRLQMVVKLAVPAGEIRRVICRE